MTKVGGAGSGEFSAAPSALGYLYQFEVALLEFLRRDDPALEVSIEVLDDIALEGDQIELVQTKLEITPGSLSDGSAALWKTLRVWSGSVAANPHALLIMITTAAAPQGSIASLLRTTGRNPAGAHDRLVGHAKAAAGANLKSARAAFLGLAESERRAMVERIVIADESPGIGDLDEEFESALRHAALRSQRHLLAERLREWWLGRAERHLIEVAAGKPARISGEEIEVQLDSLRDQFTSENLPNDFEAMSAPSDEEVAEDRRAFVMQLRLISLANERIRMAIHDHNRAFAQRSRWLRENLLPGDELEIYEQRLREEWKRIWLPETDGEFDGLDDAAAGERGRSVFKGCSEGVIEPIRPKFSAAHINRGSFHILAEDRQIGWHHDWVERLQRLLAEVGG
jgi:hypothetical protein